MNGGSWHCTGVSDQDHPQGKRNAKRQNGCLRRSYKELRREAKCKGEKERHTHLNAEFQRIVRRDRKAFLSDQCKEIEENKRMGKTRGLLKKIRDTKASSPIISWQIDGQTGETVADFIFLGSKITADGDCSHKIKRRLLLGRKVMTNLDSILKSRDITLSTKVCLIKAMVFPVVMYGCESWTIKKAEHWRTGAFELWCWRRLLRVPWTPTSPS